MGSPDPNQQTLSAQAIDLLDDVAYVERPDPWMLTVRSDGRAAVMRRPTAPVSLETKGAAAWFERQEFNEALARGIWTSHNTFSRLTVQDWRQFAEIDIIFHDRLTVLTGVNAAGKTTLLNLLSSHFNWSAQLINSGKSSSSSSSAKIGKLVYSNGATASMAESTVGAPGVTVVYPQMVNQQPVPGIYISSHRSVSNYLQLQNLPARFSESEALLQQFASEVQTRYQGSNSQFSPLYRMKEGLVSAALYGYGNQAVRPNVEARSIWEGFQAILSQLLPEELHFERLVVADGELYLTCAGSEFPLEAASGGISALLELSWQIFLRSRGAEAFTVVIDEPENHLHPSVQRSVIPALLRSFPKVRFVLATHSPFIVTADSDAFIYALERDDRGRVSSRRLETFNAAATPDETLTKVLGLDSPLALWAERDISAAIAATPDDPTVEDLRALKERLASLGLERQFPAAIDAIDTRADA